MITSSQTPGDPPDTPQYREIAILCKCESSGKHNSPNLSLNLDSSYPLLYISMTQTDFLNILILRLYPWLVTTVFLGWDRGSSICEDSWVIPLCSAG